MISIRFSTMNPTQIPTRNPPMKTFWGMIRQFCVPSKALLLPTQV